MKSSIAAVRTDCADESRHCEPVDTGCLATVVIESRKPAAAASEARVHRTLGTPRSKWLHKLGQGSGCLTADADIKCSARQSHAANAHGYSLGACAAGFTRSDRMTCARSRKRLGEVRCAVRGANAHTTGQSGEQPPRFSCVSSGIQCCIEAGERMSHIVMVKLDYPHVTFKEDEVTDLGVLGSHRGVAGRFENVLLGAIRLLLPGTRAERGRTFRHFRRQAKRQKPQGKKRANRIERIAPRARSTESEGQGIYSFSTARRHSNQRSFRRS